MDSSFRATDTYVEKLPSPPRVKVPVPMHIIWGDGNPITDVAYSGSNFCALWTPRDPIEWKYESRREAQKILPYLYLGPMSAARDKEFLREAGITMVLAVRFTQSLQGRMFYGALKAAEELDLERVVIDVANNQALIAAFPHATATINDHVFGQSFDSFFASNDIANIPHKKALLFCETGNEKSAAIFVAYLMETVKLIANHAIQVVQAHRFCVHIDESMRHMLLAYQDILDAKRDVGTTTSTANQQHLGVSVSHLVKSKRSFDQSAEADTNMEVEDDERFRDRHFAPFQE